MQRRRQTKKDAGQQGDSSCKKQDTQVYPNVLSTWQVAGIKVEESGESPIGHTNSRRCPDKRKHERFRDKLADNPRTARSYRQAQSDLTSPSGAAGQQQIGHIGAGNQKHQAHGCEQNHQGSTRITHDEFELRPDSNTHRAVGIRIFPCQSACNGRHFSICPFLCNPGPQTGNCAQMMVVALPCRWVFLLLFKVVGECEPQINGFSTDRELEALRHHADNGNSHAIQVDCFSKNITTSIEMRAPETIAQNSHIWSGQIFIVSETASQGGTHPQQVEQARRYSFDLYMGCPRTFSHGEAAAVKRSGLKSAAARAHIFEIRIGEGSSGGSRGAIPGIRLAHVHQLLRIMKWQWPQ